MLSKIKSIKKLKLSRESIIDFNDEIYKVNYKVYENLPRKGKLILVTALTPTKFGEGKTTVSIGLADSLHYLKKNVLLSLREPSMGPCFGTKGGAVGGGECLLLPKDKINMTFTGDFNNVTTINNLISSAIDNECYFNSELNIDPNKTTFHRCLDICDRFLKEVTLLVERKKNPSIEYKTSFVITAASEIMAIFTLSKDEEDFRNRIEDIVVGFTKDDKIVTVKQLGITNALMHLAKEMLYPNLVVSKYGTPSFVHAGPFANIATGTSSAISLFLSLRLADYVVTECGFGADLGFEKYVDIVSRSNDVYPDLVILVATIKAIKAHGDGSLEVGIGNLIKHYENVKKTNLPCVVALNRFKDDTDEEIEEFKKLCGKYNIVFECTNSFAEGEVGSIDLANKVVSLLSNKEFNKKENVDFFYDENDTLEDKIEKIAIKVYGCNDVEYSEKALKDIKLIKQYGFDKFNVCMAKTPLSFTDDPKIPNRGDNSTLHITKVEFNAGSKLVIPYTGEMILMPGLSKDPLMKHFSRE